MGVGGCVGVCVCGWGWGCGCIWGWVWGWGFVGVCVGVCVGFFFKCISNKCQKAYDSINRKVMFVVRRHYGIPEVVVNVISVLYKNSNSAVMMDEGLSDPLDVTTGVLQGDVLAPFLFVVLIDYLLKKATSQLDSGVVTHPRHSRRHPAKLLNDPDFADDIALLESSIFRSQAQLT